MELRQHPSDKDVIVTADLNLCWTISAIAKNFGCSRDTIVRKLAAAGIATADQYNTQDIKKALFSDLSAERIANLQANTELVAVKTGILKGEYLHRESLQDGLQQLMAAICQIIDASKISPDERHEIRQNLSSIPIILDQTHKAQTGAAIKDEISGADKKRGRKKKIQEENLD